MLLDFRVPHSLLTTHYSSQKYIRFVLRDLPYRMLEFLIQSNAFIAFAAVFYTVQTSAQLGIQPGWHPYLFLIFFATLLEYNAHRLLTVFFNREALDGPKHAWVKTHLRLFYVIVSLSVLGFLIASFLAKTEVLIVLFPLGMLTLLYSLPLYKKENRVFRLREIPLLKIFIISFVWAVTTVLLPVIQTGRQFEAWKLIAIMAERFLFIFAIAIPFDIRDMAQDRISGLRTLPILLGEKTALRMGDLALLLFCAIALSNNNPMIAVAMLVSAVLVWFCLHSGRIRSWTWYHYGVLDGSIIFQSILVLALHSFL